MRVGENTRVVCVCALWVGVYMLMCTCVSARRCVPCVNMYVCVWYVRACMSVHGGACRCKHTCMFGCVHVCDVCMRVHLGGCRHGHMCACAHVCILSFLNLFIYLFIFGEMGREGEREEEKPMWERNTHRLPLTRSQPGTWPTTQARALTRN